MKRNFIKNKGQAKPYRLCTLYDLKKYPLILIKCPQCGRVVKYREGIGYMPKSYKLEGEELDELLRESPELIGGDVYVSYGHYPKLRVDEGITAKELDFTLHYREEYIRCPFCYKEFIRFSNYVTHEFKQNHANR